MRVGLNLLHAGLDIGGGWNYIATLVASVVAHDRRHEFVAFVTDVSAALVPAGPNVRFARMPVRAGSRLQRIAFEHSVLQPLIWREGLDCVHWFANTQGIVNAAPAVVTIYDLQPFVGLAPMPALKRRFLQWRLRSTVAHAPVLLPMSQSTADDLQRRLGADPARMIVVPPRLESDFQPGDEAAVRRVRDRYRLPAAFWLYVAHFYPHKNHERLLEAYAQLARRQPDTWPLVLRGDAHPAGPDIGAIVRRLDLAGRVLTLPRLDRGELPAVYSAASAMIFPSLYEGAGIPVLEALACGCPVAAADIPAAREFAGEAATYFDPTSVDDIVRAMAALPADRDGQQRRRASGLELAEGFRAASSVEPVLEAYARACGASQPASPGPGRDAGPHPR